MNKKFRLNDSKTFCMAPWVSINNNPNGNILPCCVSEFHKPFGNLYEDNLETIWNNHNFKQLRKNILDDVETSSCNKCYKEEEWGSFSYRQYWNNNFGNKYDELINNTDNYGHLNTMKLYRWDFRFNNLCNLACIGCGVELSSGWIELNKKINSTEIPKVYNSRDKIEQFLNTITTQAQYVEEVYFAGGEPLMHNEQYLILNELEKQKKIDKVSFIYSTNLTNLIYKKFNIIDYWKKMNRCKILVSIDEIDKNRLYYIRYPAELEKIIENIKTINEIFCTVEKTWSIVPTWNLLNIHRIKEIIEFFYIHNLFPKSFNTTVSWDIDMCSIILTDPSYLSISSATTEWKKNIETKLDEFEFWYEHTVLPLKEDFIKPIALKILRGNIKKFKKSLNENTSSCNFSTYIKSLDKARGTCFNDIFPELKWCLSQDS